MFQKIRSHIPATESEILQFIAYFLAIVVTIFFWGNIGQYIVYAFSQYVDGDWKLSSDMGSNKFHGRR